MFFKHNTMLTNIPTISNCVSFQASFHVLKKFLELRSNGKHLGALLITAGFEYYWYVCLIAITYDCTTYHSQIHETLQL